MWLMKVMRQGSELHGLASYINKYNWLCVFRWGIDRQRKPGSVAGLMISGVALSDNAHTHVQDFHALSVHRHSHELLDRIGHSNCM